MEGRPLPSSAEPEFGFRIRQGARLPHWTLEGGVYAVTFHLADSIPASVRCELKHQREALQQASELRGSDLTPAELSLLQELFSYRVDRFLHNGRGACWLCRSEIAALVKSAFEYFHEERYQLLAWTVMPNHVHAVLKPDSSFSLERILHSWKSFTARQANQILERSGEFWGVEYFDHLIRDETDLRNQVLYVLNNPLKAGLRDWKWVGYNLEGIEFGR